MLLGYGGQGHAAGRTGMVFCVFGMWVVDALASAVLTGRAQDHLDSL